MAKRFKTGHRPLKPGELRHSFRRHRYDDAAAEEELWQCCEPRFALDGCWNGDDPNQDSGYESWQLSLACYSSFNDFSGDWPAFELRQSLFELSEIWNLFDPETRSQLSALADTDDVPPVHPKVNTSCCTNVESRLADYMELLSQPKSKTMIRSMILEAVKHSESLDVVKQASRRFSSPQLANYICLFAPFWVRSPHTWNRSGSYNSLLDHVFALHSVPAYLYDVWRDLPELLNDELELLNDERNGGGWLGLKWHLWFIVLAQGGSLKKAGTELDWRIRKKSQQYLYEVPADAPPVEACLYAEVRRLGGSKVDFERIKRHDAFVHDPSEMSISSSRIWFWEQSVRWIVDHREEITDEQAQTALDWAMHEYTEAERNGHRCQCWKGLSARSVIRKSEQYATTFRLSSRWVPTRWQNHGWDWSWETSNNRTWTFVELTSTLELIDEGTALWHCVASYDASCVKGDSAIVSLRKNGRRKLTLEISPASGHIRQALGRRNRLPTPEENAAIRAWRDAVVQPVSVVQ